jgi:hypothetical protein
MNCGVPMARFDTRSGLTLHCTSFSITCTRKPHHHESDANSAFHQWHHVKHILLVTDLPKQEFSAPIGTQGLDVMQDSMSTTQKGEMLRSHLGSPDQGILFAMTSRRRTALGIALRHKTNFACLLLEELQAEVDIATVSRSLVYPYA